MPRIICRCCGNDVTYPGARVEIQIRRHRPTPGMHASGAIAAISCRECADDVTAGCLHVATLWTPDGCAHHTGALF